MSNYNNKNQELGLNTKEKIDAFVNLVDSLDKEKIYYLQSAEQRVSSYYVLESFLHFAQDCGGAGIKIHVDYKSDTDKYNAELCDNIVNMKLMGSSEEGEELFNYLIHQKNFLDELNGHNQILDALMGKQSHAGHYEFELSRESIEDSILASVKNYSPGFMELFQSFYSQIKDRERAIMQKIDLSCAIGDNIKGPKNIKKI